MALQELESHIIDDNEIFGPPDLEELNLEIFSYLESGEVESDPRDPETHDLHDCNRRSGGPRTPEDKAISSQNATRHGCRSKTLILRHTSAKGGLCPSCAVKEPLAEYEALQQRWWDEYQPLGQAEETLVQLLIDNHWFLKRAGKRLEQVEGALSENVYEWTDADKKMLNTFQRYKTAAERAYYKSFREVEAYLRECVRAENAAYKADLLRLKIEAQIANKPAKAKHIELEMATRDSTAIVETAPSPAPSAPPKIRQIQHAQATRSS